MGKAAKKPVFERFTTITGTAESFIADGYAEIQAVGEEFREAYDNAPDNLKGSSVNEARDSTASEIEGLSEPSVDSSVLGGLSCTCRIDKGKVYRGRQTQSRACRLSNGAAQLRAAAEAVQSWLSENDELPEADTNDADSMKERAERLEELAVAGIDAEDYEKALEDAEQLASDCEEIADTVENLECPGMFG